MLSKIFIIALLSVVYTSCHETNDDNGYILYCPCMGRFGNQAEQLLGTLRLAKSLDRTLVLPPFIEYLKSQVNFIPFSSVINVTRLKEFHRVITIESFMEYIAPIAWGEENRPVFCYSERPGKSSNDCNPCEGNPFEPFWKQYNVSSFSSSVFHGPLPTDPRYSEDWKRKYSKYKVLTFVGAPSSFPVDENSVAIQEYVSFSQEIIQMSSQYKEERNLSTPYIGVHLRWGSDWQRTCSLLDENPMERLFSSSQCSNGKASLPVQLCKQDIELVTKTIARVAALRNLSRVFIASDLDDKLAWQFVYDSLKNVDPNFVIYTPTSVYGSNSKHFEKATHFLTDLYLLSSSDIFVGNCISSFSAFVSRMRIHSLKLPKESTTFFGMEYLSEKNKHIEL